MLNHLLRPLKNSRGSAIMFSMFLMSLLVFIAMEVSKDTVVEYEGSLNSVRRVQAYYAAKSCTDLSMLRIKAYQQARQLAKQLPDPSLLEMIWQFPLSWPLPAPEGASESDKDAIKKTTALSTFKHTFASKIESESRKIDINDLASASQSIRDKTHMQILNFFQSKLREQDSEWAKKYSNFRFDNLINNIADWIDSDSDSLNGGNESSYYTEMRSQNIPPNQSFKTLEELHMVKDMEDEIYDVLAPAITIYGGKGVNINYAEKDFLMSLDQRITDQVAEAILKRRNDPSIGGRFKDDKDFLNFLTQYGIADSDFNKDKVPLYFDQEVNFYISCIGSVGRITREIETVIFDFKRVQSRLSNSLAQDNLPANDPCSGKSGDDKYNCLCQNETDSSKKKTCIDTKKAADSKAQDQSTNTPPEPGPPYIIFQDVK